MNVYRTQKVDERVDMSIPTATPAAKNVFQVVFWHAVLAALLSWFRGWPEPDPASGHLKG